MEWSDNPNSSLNYFEFFVNKMEKASIEPKMSIKSIKSIIISINWGLKILYVLFSIQINNSVMHSSCTICFC